MSYLPFFSLPKIPLWQFIMPGLEKSQNFIPPLSAVANYFEFIVEKSKSIIGSPPLFSNPKHFLASQSNT